MWSADWSYWCLCEHVLSLTHSLSHTHTPRHTFSHSLTLSLSQESNGRSQLFKLPIKSCFNIFFRKPKTRLGSHSCATFSSLSLFLSFFLSLSVRLEEEQLRQQQRRERQDRANQKRSSNKHLRNAFGTVGKKLEPNWRSRLWIQDEHERSKTCCSLILGWRCQSW